MALGEESNFPRRTYGRSTRYTGFLFLLTVAFGVAFELPLVMAFLTHLDIVRARTYREKRRVAYFGLAVVSAVLTPGDIVPMLMMAVPMVGLYEFGVFLAAVMGRRLERRYALETDSTETLAEGDYDGST